MSKSNANTPKGMRDFGPLQMSRRNFIFNKIKTVFKKYGFQPLETPAMENLSVLTGKYGTEGDQLLFKVLNSGDFSAKIDFDDLEKGSKNILPKISEKGLKYDLTVPFARYIAKNRQDLPIPFKRYQIQPVWRADRPQKGRYREFYQCDADVVGSKSLVTEAELLTIIQEVLTSLKIPNFEIKLNHRGILQGICEKAGISSLFTDFCVALDKLDKVGSEKVKEEWLRKGISEDQINILEKLIQEDNSLFNLENLGEFLIGTPNGENSVNELREVFSHLSHLNKSNHAIQLDPTLARGLSYYTGAIYEVKVPNSGIGSIAAGGRYDDLTALFGGEALPGIGLSFGVDRIYDVMEHFELFPEDSIEVSRALFFAFDQKDLPFCLESLQQVRASGISTEIYSEKAKLKKVMSYADKKGIPYVVLIGSEEVERKTYSLKNMITGDQTEVDIEGLMNTLSLI